MESSNHGLKCIGLWFLLPTLAISAPMVVDIIGLISYQIPQCLEGYFRYTRISWYL